ncbi:anoctamin-3-like [Aethina tumida]|uniref:anoctamin-3-like n=1 Tax=Aethina tumida TaxID=116153 RepID=UPI002148466E|nr:anoctamin-3-like [Aethina tumida]
MTTSTLASYHTLQQRNIPVFKKKTLTLAGGESIDYVLVYRKSKLRNNRRVQQLQYFVRNLQRLGMIAEGKKMSIEPDVRFVLLHASDKMLLEYATAFKIDLTMNSTLYNYRSLLFPFAKNELIDPGYFNPIIQRSKTFLGERPTTLTRSEKICFISEILSRNRFGSKPEEYGINTLKSEGILVAEYPMHEGPYQWTDHGLLNDRQLLYEFWVRPKRWYKEQPNNIIETYLGTEYAFYYRWLGLYTTMLVIPALGSIIVIIFGLSTLNQDEASKEICESTHLMCPKCASCKYEWVNSTCSIYRSSYIINNSATTAFAICISMWSTIVVALWYRIEVTSQMKWNVKFLETDLTMRMEYKQYSYYRVISDDGELEPYIPWYYWIIRTSITFCIMLLMAVIIILINVIARDVVIKWMKNALLADDGVPIYPMDAGKNNLIALFMSANSQVVAMIICQQVYYKIILSLIKLENPRTELELDNSYVFKCYILDILNHYTSLIYNGFLKGLTYDYPKTKEYEESVFHEMCFCTTNCTMEMVILQFTIWLVRTFFRIFTKFIIPSINVTRAWNKYGVGSKYPQEDLDQWEHDFLLNATDRHLLMDEYLDTLVEYGYCTFFISAFPMAPMCAFVTNIVHLRIDAYKTMILYRRPNCRKIAKLPCWSKILKFHTYLGITTNAAMIAFNTDFVIKIFYGRVVDPSLRGIVGYGLTKFNTSMVYSSENYVVNETICYFPGMNYDYTNVRTPSNYWVLFSKFLAVILIQHFVYIIQAFLTYIIPDIPYAVKVEIANQQKKKREQNMKAVEQQRISERNKDPDHDRFELIT